MRLGTSNYDLTANLVQMSDRLALSVGYNLQNNSNPPAGLEKRDTTQTVNLVFVF